MKRRSDLALPVRPDALRFILLALLGPMLLVMVAAVLDRHYAQSEALQLEAHLSGDRRVVTARLIPRIVDAESSQRGFIITGDDRFLKAYAPARAAVFTSFNELIHDLSADPVQRAWVADLQELARRKFAEMDHTIAVRRATGSAQVSQLVAEGSGQVLMDRMRARSNEIVQTMDIAGDRAAARLQRDVVRDVMAVWIAIAVLALISCAIATAFWRQSIARYAARRQAYEIAERNRTILDSTVDAMAIINPHGVIETINPAAANLLGYPPNELIGKPVTAIVRVEPGLGGFHDRIGLVDGRIDNPYRPDRTVLHRDGHEITVDVALGVIDLPDGLYVVVSARDVSERKRIERMKDALMSTVSHELRTPLTSVVGALGLLRAGAAGAIPQPAGRLIEIAENNSRRLIRLINDMLDIDRIQAGTLQLARVPIDLRTVVDRAAIGSQGLAAAESVQIACTMPDTAVLVIGDADRLLQVITNLVSNAVRATPTGGIVTIGLSTLEPSGKAIVTVDDEGAGVPTEFRNRIFGRFERADGEQGVGTGLGLSIAREIVLRHDGRIWFEDRPPRGSRFGFVLDLRREAAGLRDTSHKPCVLVCEDDAGMARTLTSMVTELGCGVESATTAADARAAFARRHFDAVLLDLKLPSENGLALARALRSNPGAEALPIILVSSAGSEPASDPIPCDFVDWISHPIDPERLQRAIDAAITHTGGATGTTRATILHVDDDPDVLALTKTTLHRDARVLQASDLVSARKLLETERPDLVILDLHLPEGSGLQLLPMLIDAQGLAIPTIIFSAHDITPDAAQLVDAVLVKSRGSLPDLRATVRRILEQRAPV